jgi:hypothetical protein
MKKPEEINTSRREYFSRRVIEGEAYASIVKVNAVLRHDPIAALLGIFLKAQRKSLMLYARSLAVVGFEINVQTAPNLSINGARSQKHKGVTLTGHSQQKRTWASAIRWLNFHGPFPPPNILALVAYPRAMLVNTSSRRTQAWNNAAAKCISTVANSNSASQV